MILGHEKFRIPDENRQHDLILEVNWNEKDPKTNECKVIKVTNPDKSESFIKKEFLHSFMFAISKDQEQRDLIPKKIQTIRKYQTMLGITASKDIKKGEKINVMVDIPLPPIEKEILEQAKKEISRGQVRAVKS